jgi:hypothetical protein
MNIKGAPGSPGTSVWSDASDKSSTTATGNVNIGNNTLTINGKDVAATINALIAHIQSLEANNTGWNSADVLKPLPNPIQ